MFQVSQLRKKEKRKDSQELKVIPAEVIKILCPLVVVWHEDTTWSKTRRDREREKAFWRLETRWGDFLTQDTQDKDGESGLNSRLPTDFWGTHFCPMSCCCWSSPSLRVPVSYLSVLYTFHKVYLILWERVNEYCSCVCFSRRSSRKASSQCSSITN